MNREMTVLIRLLKRAIWKDITAVKDTAPRVLGPRHGKASSSSSPLSIVLLEEVAQDAGKEVIVNLLNDRPNAMIAEKVNSGILYEAKDTTRRASPKGPSCVNAEAILANANRSSRPL